MYIVCVFTVVYFIVKNPDIHVCIRNNKVILNLNLNLSGMDRIEPGLDSINGYILGPEATARRSTRHALGSMFEVPSSAKEL